MATRKATTKRKTTGRSAVGVSSRARVIWVALVASMTTVGGVLYALDPSAKSAAAAPLIATATAARTAPEVKSGSKAGVWTRILLIETGSPFGDAAELREQGLKAGEPAGVGYHMVIGNGRGLDDGRAYECKFWQEQRSASKVYAPEAIDDRTIVISLVGNTRRDRVTEAQFERTRSLVANLMLQYKISFDHVDFSRLGPGFGAASFREAFGG